MSAGDHQHTRAILLSEAFKAVGPRRNQLATIRAMFAKGMTAHQISDALRIQVSAIMSFDPGSQDTGLEKKVETPKESPPIDVPAAAMKPHVKARKKE